jgi:hypothetical protein
MTPQRADPSPIPHRRLSGDRPPGSIGARQLLVGAAFRGVYGPALGRLLPIDRRDQDCPAAHHLHSYSATRKP